MAWGGIGLLLTVSTSCENFIGSLSSLYSDEVYVSTLVKLHLYISTHLLLSNEGAPEHAHTLAEHAHLEVVLLLEPVDNLLEGRVVLELDTVPERPLSVTILALGRSDRLREAEEGQSKVDEPVLVLLNILLAIDDLCLQCTIGAITVRMDHVP